MCCCSNGTADCSVCKEKYIFTERDLSSRPSGYLTARTMAAKAAQIAQYEKGTIYVWTKTYQRYKLQSWANDVWRQRLCEWLVTKRELCMCTERYIKQTTGHAWGNALLLQSCVKRDLCTTWLVTKRELYMCTQRYITQNKRDISVRPKGAPEGTRYCSKGGRHFQFVVHEYDWFALLRVYLHSHASVRVCI